MHYWGTPTLMQPLFMARPLGPFPGFSYQMSPHIVPDVSSQVIITGPILNDPSGIPGPVNEMTSVPIPLDAPTIGNYNLPTPNDTVSYLLPANRNHISLQQQIGHTLDPLAGLELQTHR